MKLDFNDILIEPAVQTNINTRSIINPFLSNGNLPLITAPMDTVVNRKNYKHFLHNNINVCFPRNGGIKSFNDSVFESLSLDEFKETFLSVTHNQKPNIIPIGDKRYILIDIANGHMSDLLETVKSVKAYYGDKIFLMVGNVANPVTYGMLAKAGAQGVRIGVGNGGGCLTTQNLGVGYPMASLIQECRNIKIDLELNTLIIADGGMQNYSDIIKALALGADLVMVGSIFNKALESCGRTKLFNLIKINPYSKFAKWCMKKSFPITKLFYGMSTKIAQKKWGKSKLKTSEGVVRTRHVEYTLKQWSENFEDYLRSAMSYTNSKTLHDFIGNVNINQISEQSYKRFNK